MGGDERRSKMIDGERELFVEVAKQDEINGVIQKMCDQDSKVKKKNNDKKNVGDKDKVGRVCAHTGLSFIQKFIC